MTKSNISTEDKLINAGLKGIDEYYEGLKSVGGTFFDITKSLEKAKEKAFLSYRMIFRKELKELSKEEQHSSFEEQFQLIQPTLRERATLIRDRFQKRLIIKDINTTSANSVIQDALEANGFKAKVEVQSYRAKVALKLTRKYKITFYVKYKDLFKDGEMERIVFGLKEIQNELDELTFPVAVRTRAD